MANKILIGDLYTFSDTQDDDGVLMSGAYLNQASLSFDELAVDTLDFSVRYFGEGNLFDILYGTPVTYYKNGQLVGKYFLENTEQKGAEIWDFSCVSAMGMLESTFHYGGLYTGQWAADIIADVIGNTIEYSVRQIFSRIKLYGWLPIGTRRENLQQVLFACGGCIRKDSNGNPYITVLENTTPIVIPENRITNGKITFEKKATQVNVTEHAFAKVDGVPEETLFEGELSGNRFTTPLGHNVTNAALVRFEGPYHSVAIEGTQVLNDEIGVNYVVVRASGAVTITGKPYVHSENIIYRENDDVPPNNGENILTVTDATLVSLANSSSVGERALGYHGYANTVHNGIYLNAEVPGDTVEFTNPWGKTVRGIIKELDTEMGSNENYADAVIMSDYTPPIIQASHTLVSIAVTTPPERTAYEAGEKFSTKGMVVTATYDDNETAIIKNYNYEPSGVLTPADTEIVISYREMGVTATTTQPIEVTVVLKTIDITEPPTQVIYGVGEVFNPDGMVVTAHYSDGTNHPVTGYTFEPSGPLTAEDTEVEITYEEDGIICKAYQPIAVDSTMVPESIEVTKNPDKMKYHAGEYFNSTGMVCKVTYSNGVVNNNAKGYKITPTGQLGQNDTTMTISYTYNGVTVSTTLEIEVIILTSIAVTKQPNKTSYYEDEYFSPIGMEVTATYSDGSTKEVDNYTYSPSTPLEYGMTQVTISYTEGGITKTTTLTITVDYFDYDFTKSIVITDTQNFTLQSIGATHKNIRVVCIGGGSGGQGGEGGKRGHNSNSVSAGAGSYTNGEPGEGGEGGQGGTGSIGGKIFSQDIHVASLTTSLSAVIGAGGAGGNGGASDAKGSAGSAGNATTFTDGRATISSDSGGTSQTGFTDIFTTNTYALPGNAGLAGANGGKGGACTYQALSEPGQDAGANKGGAAVQQTHIEGGSCPNYYKEEYDASITEGGTFDLPKSFSGASSKTFKSDTGTWTLGYNRNITVTKCGNPGYSGNPYLYYLEGNKVKSLHVSSASGTTYPEQTTNCTRTGTRWKATPVYGTAWTKGLGGGGGGGAAYNNSGSQGSHNGGRGGDGSVGVSPTVPGNGGNGGNGGGGGGGGGAVGIEVHKNATTTYRADGYPGGVGGAGGQGSNGANGCVIIYFS